MRNTHVAALLALAPCLSAHAAAEEPQPAAEAPESADSTPKPAPSSEAAQASSAGNGVSEAAPSEPQGQPSKNSAPQPAKEAIPSLPPLEPKPALPPSQSKTPLFLGLRLPTFIALGVGSLGAGGAVVTRLAATPQPDPKLGCNNHCSDGSHTLGMTSTILAGIAGAAVGTGLVLALSEHGRHKTQLALAPVLKMSVSPSKAAASASWTF